MKDASIKKYIKLQEHQNDHAKHDDMFLFPSNFTMIVCVKIPANH